MAHNSFLTENSAASKGEWGVLVKWGRRSEETSCGEWGDKKVNSVRNLSGFCHEFVRRAGWEWEKFRKV